MNEIDEKKKKKEISNIFHLLLQILLKSDDGKKNVENFSRYLAPDIAWLKYLSQFYYGLEAVSLTQWLLIDHIST